MNNKLNLKNRKSGFIELVLLAGLSAIGVFTYQNGHAIGQERRERIGEQAELRSGYVEMKGAINETRTVVNKHEKALQTLGPKCDWMEDLK